jgi:adenosylhomocysteine nucleosidase
MKPLAIAPTTREADAFHRLHPIICGAGETAGAFVGDLATTPDVILLGGVCGGLDPSLPAGGVILGRQVVDLDGSVIEPDRLLLDEVRAFLRQHRIPFVFSRLLTVPAPVLTKNEKRDLWNTHGAAGVDMETYHVARAAREAGISWVAVRAVVDPARSTLPRSLADWDGEAGQGALLRTAARRPAEWPAYARLALADRRARAALKRTVPAVAVAIRRARTVETLPLMEVTR